MNVSLTQELGKFIDEQLENGAYTTASEVVRDGIRLLRARNELHDKRCSKVRAKIESGWREGERSDVLKETEVRKHFQRRTAERNHQ